MILGLLVALLVLLSGVLSLLAARHPAPGPRHQNDADPTDDGTGTGTDAGPVERLAARVHDGVGRTANAVDVLVERRPADEEPRGPRARAGSVHEATAYTVFGVGLLGLGVVLAAGVLLLLG